MDMFFIVRKAKELKSSCTQVLRAAFSLERVRNILDGSGQRDRTYNPINTWIIWLGQTLDPDHTCRNALAYARSAGIVSKKTSVRTGGYCQARDRLQEEALHSIGTGLGMELMKAERPEDRWHGRRVLIPDGSSVSMPDTKANQAAYPQPKPQKAGCGFPVMYLAALLSLTSEALLDFEPGSESEGELTLWRKMWHLLQPGDIVLSDGKYPAYSNIALHQEGGIDIVSSASKRKMDFRKGKIIGLKDHLVEWERPKNLPSWTKDKSLPEKMVMRELCYRVEIQGFRSETVTIVTTLLDAELYPKEDMAELYFFRWHIELRLRDIKTMLNMDVLRTKTPERVRKELWMYLTAYNLLRTIIGAAAAKSKVMTARISFQGCRQRLLAVSVHHCSARQFTLHYHRLLDELAQDLNPDRPNRVEPRAKKRRMKQYDLLNQPREILRQKLMKKGA